MKSHRRILIAACLILSAFFIGSMAFATNSPDNQTTASAKVSASGKRVKLSKRFVKTRLSGVPSTRTLSVLGVRNGIAFYRVGTPQDTCYGLGSALSLGDPFQILCVDSGTALIDFSTVEISPKTGEVRLLRVAGIAVDEIRSVGLRSSRGGIAAQARVVGNIYSLDSPPTVEIDALVGLDASEHAIYEKPMR